MRLWSSKPSHEFDLASFNSGDYYGAVEAKERCESITSVLYPSDDNANGKVLRLKQQFFFVSATLQVRPAIIAHHVIGCRLHQEMRVHNACR